MSRFLLDSAKSIGRYHEEIRKEPLLTPEQELEVARLSREGDLAARERLIRANLRFSFFVARNYETTVLTLEDRVNEANVGLIKSAIRFDERRGGRLISFAGKYILGYIRQAIRLELKNQGRLIRLAREQDEIRRYRESIKEALTEATGRIPTEIELDTMGLVNTTYTKAKLISSIPDADDPSSVQDIYSLVADTSAPPPDAVLNKTDHSEELTQLLAVLTDVERECVLLKKGLKDGKRYTESEIAELLGITIHVVHARLDTAHRKLRLKARQKAL